MYNVVNNPHEKFHMFSLCCLIEQQTLIKTETLRVTVGKKYLSTKKQKLIITNPGHIWVIFWICSSLSVCHWAIWVNTVGPVSTLLDVANKSTSNRYS